MNQRVTITGSDEIARLGNSFNTLMDKLELAIYSEYETALQQKNAEIRALQAQMNPHFLYNVLQSMAAMADLHQVPEDFYSAQSERTDKFFNEPNLLNFADYAPFIMSSAPNDT